MCYYIVEGNDYSKVEHQLGSRNAPEMYQPHWTQCNFKSIIEDSLVRNSTLPTKEKTGLPGPVQCGSILYRSLCSAYPWINRVLYVNVCFLFCFVLCTGGTKFYRFSENRKMLPEDKLLPCL